MADYSTWFSGSEVANVLKGLQVWPEAGATSPDGSDLQVLFQEQCDIAADSVRDDIERNTGRRPFLATRSVLRHTATTPGGALQLLSPARQIYSVTVGGSVVDDSTYWMQPETAALTGDPIEFIQFSQNYFGGQVYSLPNQISIDAEWGSYSSIPPTLYRAGLNMAALFAIATIQGEQDLASISEDGFSIGSDVVGPIDDKVRIAFWPEQYKQAWKKFVRVVV